MKRLPLPVRRLCAIVGGTLLGLTTVAVLAAPASAHHTVISGVAKCATNGEQVITWKVTHSESNKTATLVTVTASPDTPVTVGDDPLQGKVLGKLGTPGDTIEATQTVPGDTTSAKLTIYAHWVDDEGRSPYDGTNEGSATMVQGGCSPTPQCVSASKATYSHTFDGPKGAATVSLDGDLPLCEGDKQDFTLVSYFAPKPKFSVPQYLNDSDTGTITSTQRKVELNVDVPDCNTQVDLFWGGASEIINPIVAGGPRYGNKKLGSSGAPGNRSKGPLGAYNGGTSSCVQPKADFVSSCDGTVTVNLSNSGKYAAEFVVTGENGFEAKKTVAPGAGASVIVPAASAGKIVVTESGKQVATSSWARPASCALPAVSAKSDCTSFAVTVTNPAGNVPVEAVIQYGDERQTVTVQAGGSETVTFKPSDAESAKITFTGLDIDRDAAFVLPANCGSGSGGGGGLPVTGASVGTAVGMALGLLAIGGALFTFFRRRRIHFTA